VRVEGAVEELTDDESAAYFETRPRNSQIGAWASPQSHPVADRSELERRAAEIELRFASEASVPLPPFWGGYRIVATTIEFWQGRPGRLHDRVQYVLGPDGWTRQRLAP
jgi:pyridoxamine 5'-phosphate oxidase